MIPRNPRIPSNNQNTASAKKGTSTANATSDSSPKKDRKIFNQLIKLRTLSFDTGKVLLENETALHLDGYMMFAIGIFLPFWRPENLSIFLCIPISIVLIAIGFLIIRQLGYYSVLNFTTNSINQEYRFGSTIIYKTKEIPLSNIAQIGIDHKRQRARGIGRGGNYYHLAMSILSFIRGVETVDTKPVSMLDGCIERTAIAYLTKNGEIGHFNEFSDKIDVDNICIDFANALGIYANLPIIVANENKGLMVKKMGNVFTFDEKSIKPTILGEIIKTAAIAFGFIIAAIVGIYLLTLL